MLTVKEFHRFPYSCYPNVMSEEMSIFQSAEMQRCFSTNSLMYAVPKRMKPRTLACLDDNVPVLIFPLLVRGSKAELAGHANGMCELSPIIFQGFGEKAEAIFKSPS